jgi:hypothetical protein
MYYDAITGITQKMISILLHDAVFIDNLSVFWKSLLPHFKIGYFICPEDGSSKLLRNAGDKSPFNMAAYTRRVSMN